MLGELEVVVESVPMPAKDGEHQVSRKPLFMLQRVSVTIEGMLVRST